MNMSTKIISTLSILLLMYGSYLAERHSKLPRFDIFKSHCIHLAASGDKDVCKKCPAPKTTTTPTTTTTRTTTTIPPTTPKPKVTDLRLPTSVSPLHYNIDITTFIHSSDPSQFSYEGTEKIWIQCNTPADNVTIHFRVLTIDPASIKFYGDPVSSDDPRYVTSSIDLAREFFVIKLDSNMQAGKIYILELGFTSPIKNDMVGLYYSVYSNNGKTTYLATTQMEPADARKAFPCFDEPALKATFNMSLVHPSSMISLANTLLVNTQPAFTVDGVDYVRDTYLPSPKMSSYLVAFVVCDFSFKSAVSKNGVLFRAWTTNSSIDQIDYALSVGTETLSFYEDFFGIRFPLPKQDMIGIPDFASGAMENWGLITYRQKYLLYEEGKSNEYDKEIVTFVVTHELAHQWFGDLVSPRWWDDLWLNEGFATFMQYLGVDHVQPDWKFFDIMTIRELQKAMSLDSLVSSHPLYVPITLIDDILQIFDSVSYSKGGCIIRMLRQFIGVETFKRGMNRYLTRYMYSTATHNDLWDAIAEQTALDGKTIDVKDIMNTWTVQMNYPLVTVTRDTSSPDVIIVSQQRYLSAKNAVDPGTYQTLYGYKWTIPVTVTSSKNPNFDEFSADVLWLTRNETSKSFTFGAANLPDINDPNGWILANIAQVGYYRVTYPVSNWLALSNQLKTNHEVISAVNRGQIINDAWSLVRSGDLGIDVALKLFDYLDNEHDYVPWFVATNEFKYLSQMLSLNPLFGRFREYMKDKYGKSFKYFGLDNTGSSHLEIGARQLVAKGACSYGVKECLDAAISLYRQWMADPRNNPIDPDLKPVVYCSAIEAGGLEEWNFGLKIYTDPAMFSETNYLLDALSCSKDVWLVNNFISYVIQDNSPVRKQDTIPLLTTSTSKTLPRILFWNFFKANFDKFMSIYGTQISLANVIISATSAFNTDYELADLKAFKAAHEGQWGSASKSIEQAIETVSSNVKWMKDNQAAIDQWLADAGY
ncbi:aminopeptidase N-like [Physella acuta]|uniref:aminopeptidase N-like n=1 Tax=Physella acuta TaxID=109671 RepID=UPI0027DC1FE1|nr:aminopeptidase N-like [Physella acuta]XP_059158624.1 aminopeptidase N-like [Physella acuta]